MREARSEIEALGADVLAVGRRADYQARALIDEHDDGFELLLDPEGRLSDRLDMGGFAWWRWLMPSTWWKYVRWSTSARQGRPFLSTVNAQPGVVIVDPDGRVVWAHRGVVVGDYPPVAEVLDALRAATA